MISVICPVYNTSKYLDNLFNSLKNNLSDDDELIIINDCSTDNSNDLINDWKQKFKNCIHINLEKNIGLGDVRNLGLEKSSQQYVVFLDSDDELAENSIFRIKQKIKNYPSDIFLFGYHVIFNGQIQKTTIPQIHAEIYHTNLRNFPELSKIQPCWSIVYSREFLINNRLKFFRRYFEDADFVFRCVHQAESISVCNRIVLTKYFKRESSITNSALSPQKIECLGDHYINIFETIERLKKSKFYNFNEIKTERTIFYFKRFIKVFYQMRDFEHVQILFYQKVQRAFQRNPLNEKQLASGLQSEKELKKIEYFILLYQIIIAKLDISYFKKIYQNQLDSSTVNHLIKLSSPPLTSSLINFISSSNKILVSPNKLFQIPHIKKIYIHIGLPKAGSTYFQNFCLKNYLNLLDQKILFPKYTCVLDDTLGAHRLSGHDHLRFILQPNSKEWRKFENDLFLEIQSNLNANTLILSVENLFFEKNQDLIISKLKKLFIGKEISVVANLREPFTWAYALYREYVCGGNLRYQLDFNNFLQELTNEQKLNFSSNLKRWEDLGLLLVSLTQNFTKYFFEDLLRLNIDDFSSPSTIDQNSLKFTPEQIDSFRTFNILTADLSKNEYKNYLKNIHKDLNIEKSKEISLPKIKDDIYFNINNIFNENFNNLNIELDFHKPSDYLYDQSKYQNFLQLILKSFNFNSKIKSSKKYKIKKFIISFIYKPTVFTKISKIYYLLLRSPISNKLIIKLRNYIFN